MADQVTPAAPDWRAIFDAAVEELGPVKLATRLGYNNHSLVCLVRSGRKAASPDFRRRVIDRLYVVPECPATGLEQPRIECRRLSRGPAPTQNPLAMRIWRECQRCPHRPEQE